LYTGSYGFVLGLSVDKGMWWHPAILNKSEKGCLEIWRNKTKFGKIYGSGKNLHKK
jgi:hypothetical protein